MRVFVRVLVAGATGFVGRELVRVLFEKGHDILILTRNVESAVLKIPAGCKVIEWSPNVNFLAPSLISKVDVVINLAGENIADGRWTKKRKKKILDSRVMSVKRLAEALKFLNHKPKLFISASAIGYYGNCDAKEIDEKTSIGNGFLSDVCQKWENEIFEIEKLGIRTVACRIGMVLGHDGGVLKRMILPFKLGLGGKLGTGKQWISWIHINDLVNILVYTMEDASINGVINAVSPNPTMNIDFTSVLGKTLNRPTIFALPTFFLRFIFGELSELLLGSQRVLANRMLDKGFKFQYGKLEDALMEVCRHPC